MLVTFYCDEYENITMFGDVAKQLLNRMGHSGTVPGAIVANEIPSALEKLEQSLKQDKQKSQAPSKNQTANEQDDESISLAHRAFPLLNMLKAASKKNCNIMWK